MKNQYVVMSHTTREQEGHPELCWMEIRTEKLNEAVDKKVDYEFLCCIGEEKFKYKLQAEKLHEFFLQKKVRINNSKKKEERKYSFYIDYEIGKLYRNLTRSGEKDNFICGLNVDIDDDKGNESKEKAITTLIGDEVLNKELDEKGIKLKLAQVVASTAIFVPIHYYTDCKKRGSDAKCPWIRRKNSTEKRGWVSGESKTIVQRGKKLGDNEVWPEKLKVEQYLDDNSYPNSQMKAAIKSTQTLLLEGYETCHIWQDTCDRLEYHTCYANLVMLPRAIASLSDHNTFIQNVLKYKAYRYFGWYPTDKNKPEKPDGYDDLKWKYISDLECSAQK